MSFFIFNQKFSISLLTFTFLKLELKRIQTVSPNDYQKVFSLDNKNDKFYFGRSDVQFCNRFDAGFSVREFSQMVSSAHTPTNGIYFGHVECLVVKSPQMEFYNETDQFWVDFCSMQHLSTFVAYVYVLIVTSNDCAFNCFKKSGFCHLKFVGEKGI
ncbi:hypothetical protein RFI_00219 [Reticulomyxa filosa]|uniref:Uncharacterized protein n=1 Tax=Reticulomyxa filosa TaxID=46433 RepID=X6PFG7_RETFI|nr:hypothetical protein RFI_00219 [Reticulomyxa filosa]|eukprot:ETO36843.1 hypothetical protein RFI_00219 [Reticulomyxa filosa]